MKLLHNIYILYTLNYEYNSLLSGNIYLQLIVWVI